jgi:hypothetical protein
MKTKQIKKVISVVLCVSLLLSVMPIIAVAGSENTLTAEENGLVTDFTGEKSSYTVSSDFVIENGVLVAYIGKNPNLVIPANLGITEIGWGALGSCDSVVESVVIPEGVTNISYIGGNRRLNSVTLPSTLKSIGSNAFNGTGITSVTIPAGVEYVNVASNNHTGLLGIEPCQIIFEAEVPPVIGNISPCWWCKGTECSYSICWDCLSCDCPGWFVGGCPEYYCSLCEESDCPQNITCPDWFCWICDSTTCPAYADCPEYECWVCGDSNCDMECFDCVNCYDNDGGCWWCRCSGCYKLGCPGCCWACETVGCNGHRGCPKYYCFQCDRYDDCVGTIYVPVGSKAAYEEIEVFKKGYKIVEGAAPPPPEPWKWNTIKYGIVTGGDRIRINDALEMLKHLAGITQLTGNSFQAALVTQESRNLNRIRINDVLEVLKHLAGISKIS